MKTCVVVGGGGFIGSNLCHYLERVGYRVVSYGRRFLTRVVGVQYVEAAAEDSLELDPLILEADVVINLVHGSRPATAEADIPAALQSAASSALSVAMACRLGRPKRLIYASSGGTVYGHGQNELDENSPTDPVSAYGVSKLAVEKLMGLEGAVHGLDYRILRIANPYGYWQWGSRDHGLVSRAMTSVLGNAPLPIFGSGNVVRDFVFIEDVCAAFAALIEYAGPHRCFNIGGGEGGTSVIELVRAIERITGKTATIDYMPSRSFDVESNVLSIRRANEHLNWSPFVGLEAGLTKTYDWIQKVNA